jgi:hypothetical protein
LTDSATAEAPRVLRSATGRVRIRIPGGAASPALARRLLGLRGVESASASARTGNVLVRFDPDIIDEAALVDAIARAVVEGEPASGAQRRSAARERERPRPDWRADGNPSPPRRARIAVAGLERDPGLGEQIVALLEGRPGIERAVPSPLTGRVLVELSGDPAVDLGELAEELRTLEPDWAAAEDVPRHPLERSGLVQGSARAIGSTLGVGLLMARQALGRRAPPTASPAPGVVAGLATLAEAMPPLGELLEGALGYDRKELALGVASVVSLTLSGSALGLAVSGTAALRLLTESRGRRAAWREKPESRRRRRQLPGGASSSGPEPAWRFRARFARDSEPRSPTTGA